MESLKKTTLIELLQGPYTTFRVKNAGRKVHIKVHIIRPGEQKSFCGLTSADVENISNITRGLAVCKTCGEAFEAYLAAKDSRKDIVGQPLERGMRNASSTRCPGCGGVIRRYILDNPDGICPHCYTTMGKIHAHLRKQHQVVRCVEGKRDEIVFKGTLRECEKFILPLLHGQTLEEAKYYPYGSYCGYFEFADDRDGDCYMICEAKR